MLFKRIFEAILSLKKPQDFYAQLVRFIITGGFTAGIDFLLLVLFVEAFLLHYLLASGISFIVGVTINYLISRHWIFEGGRYRHSVEFLGFFVTGGIGLVLNQMILWFFVGHLSVDYKISKTISIFVVTFWNFTTKKYLVFRN
jgi:putative flippase GtrA